MNRDSIDLDNKTRRLEQLVEILKDWNVWMHNDFISLNVTEKKMDH